MSSQYAINDSLESISELYGFEFSVVDMSKLREKDLNLLSVLSEKEIEHLDGVKIEKNKIQWIAGRYAVKSALFKYKLERAVLMDLSCIDVLKGSNSAPYILQYPDLCVSITHSFPYCVGIVSGRRIGVDIDQINEPQESLIRYFYCDAEKVILDSFKGTDEFACQAMIYWTRKEAASKLLQLGMQMDFKNLDTSGDRTIIDKCNIRFESFICREFCVSIAVEEEIKK
ncbi:4'-phosphopantetheinyl transferase family protein [Acetivibrio cellulolyticus]|uniref:4'-phosphopantetheinyl transferase family protein n=1 Tax=Acetivibrio cellulolyticus TaxID=35830 RepID=UPI0001E2FB8C|nr:4'-phosphopantetheinyl transferase family protein [Acetivibrio cellulolyticus]